MADRMATTVLPQSPCSKNWKPYKIETKDIGIQAYHAVLQLSVGYRVMVHLTCGGQEHDTSMLLKSHYQNET